MAKQTQSGGPEDVSKDDLEVATGVSQHERLKEAAIEEDKLKKAAAAAVSDDDTKIAQQGNTGNQDAEVESKEDKPDQNQQNKKQKPHMDALRGDLYQRVRALIDQLFGEKGDGHNDKDKNEKNAKAKMTQDEHLSDESRSDVEDSAIKREILSASAAPSGDSALEMEKLVQPPPHGVAPEQLAPSSVERNSLTNHHTLAAASAPPSLATEPSQYSGKDVRYTQEIDSSMSLVERLNSQEPGDELDSHDGALQEENPFAPSAPPAPPKNR